MAKYFKAFARSTILRFTCAAAGAVRTGGFIPWDDDVDVFMPRESYERLRELWPTHADSRYQLVESDETFIDHDIFVAIRDAQTTFIKPYQRDIDLRHGLVFDVLPLDGCPDGFARKKQKHGLIYSLFRAQFVPEKHGGVVAMGTAFVSMVRFASCALKLLKRAERNMTKYPISGMR